jgi:hypothetical protein
VFDLDHLNPNKETSKLGKRITMTDTREHRIKTEEYEVEKIVGKKNDKRRRQDIWLVQWKGTWALGRSARTYEALLRCCERSRSRRRELRSSANLNLYKPFSGYPPASASARIYPCESQLTHR